MRSLWALAEQARRTILCVALLGQPRRLALSAQQAAAVVVATPQAHRAILLLHWPFRLAATAVRVVVAVRLTAVRL
jgi:hypothetical protein